MFLPVGGKPVPSFKRLPAMWEKRTCRIIGRCSVLSMDMQTLKFSLHICTCAKKKSSKFQSMHFVMVSRRFCQKNVQHVFSFSSGQTASVQTLHMPIPVIAFLFKVLRNALPRYILYTCPNRYSVRVQSAMQCTASVHTLHMSKPVIKPWNIWPKLQLGPEK